jgi:pyruvate dehydrogenase E1 component
MASMVVPAQSPTATEDALEIEEWIDSLDYVLARGGRERAGALLRCLRDHAVAAGVEPANPSGTAYVNTIPPESEPPYPGDRTLERRIESLVRWNAMAMVVQANRGDGSLGGHLATYASAATLYEVAFNHFLRGKDAEGRGDQVFFQGHASPGIYARAFLEGRLSEQQLGNFRRELGVGGGLPSYPHPRLMPDFWEFATVSMGLGPLMAIYQARFNRYLEDRALVKNTGKVWAFLGDGEMDEPESLGALTVAGRERLDNLIFVVNCNLQRLDGPVRGSGKIVQELEAVFQGAGWNVIKVIWSGDWDPLLARDREGLLRGRMASAVDGDYQAHAVNGGAFVRQHFFGADARLLALVEDLGDEEIGRLRRGGHDPSKIHAAYRAAVDHKGAPTVVLAKTIKGYGLGKAGEARNTAHQRKKLADTHLLGMRQRLEIPLDEGSAAAAAFHRPPDDSPEIRYLKERRAALGGPLPARRPSAPPLVMPPRSTFEPPRGASGDAAATSTTAAFVRILGQLLRDPQIGSSIVPIVPDEARTFGMEPLFQQIGIYAHVGQLYAPVDADTLVPYREARDGQMLQEGITEAGAMASFIAAGTAYATHGINLIPFFAYYSMFGFQRVGDLIWAAGDMRCRGFLLGATAGRTTLNGEGLQHQDGHSHLLAYPHPHVVAYDPAYGFEVAVIVEEGLRRMFVKQEDLVYYLTLGNESYSAPPMPEGAREGILRGLYRLRASSAGGRRRRVTVLGSGALVNAALEAQALLEARYEVSAEVWSVTSWKALHDDGLEVDRWNRLHPESPPRRAHVRAALGDDPGVVVAVTDYVKALPCSVAPWIPGGVVALGTDGFGRSETRAALRHLFEVDAAHVAYAALAALAERALFPRAELGAAQAELGVTPDPGSTPSRDEERAP